MQCSQSVFEVLLVGIMRAYVHIYIHTPSWNEQCCGYVCERAGFGIFHDIFGFLTAVRSSYTYLGTLRLLVPFESVHMVACCL